MLKVLLEIAKSEKKKELYHALSSAEQYNVIGLWFDDIRRIRPRQRKGTLLPVHTLLTNLSKLILLTCDENTRKFIAILLTSHADRALAAIRNKRAWCSVVDLANF